MKPTSRASCILASALSLVSLSAAAAVPLKPLKVEVTNPTVIVDVANQSSKPVPVKDLVAREAFQAVADAAGESFQVPPGKRFVIEYLSGRVDTSTTCVATTLVVTTTLGTGSPVSHHFIPTFILTGSLSKIYTLSVATKIYADGEVSLSNNQFAGCSSIVGDIAFSGYLVDRP